MGLVHSDVARCVCGLSMQQILKAIDFALEAKSTKERGRATTTTTKKKRKKKEKTDRHEPAFTLCTL